MRARKPDFEVTNYYVDSITPQRVTLHNSPAYAVRENWRFIEQIGLGTVYVRSIFNPETTKEDRAELEVRDGAGLTKAKLALDHGVYRFKASSGTDRFVASSDDLVLYLHSLADGCLATYDLKRHTRDKYHVRKVDISPDGKYVLFSHVDEAYLLDARLKVLNSWKTPPKPGWHKGPVASEDGLPAEFRRSLSVLGLTGKPGLDEIKRTFRALVLKNHPDLNPGNANANERMKQINLAYETVTGEKARHAFDGAENAEYYCDLIEKFEVKIPGSNETISFGFSIMGPKEDWIYATHLGGEAARVYLGCYSGRVLAALPSGTVECQYTTDGAAEYLRESNGFLYLRKATGLGTEHSLQVAKDGKFATSVDLKARDRLMWHDRGFLVVGTRQVRLFSAEGTAISMISFKESLRDVHVAGGTLSVMTKDKIYEFAIKDVSGNPGRNVLRNAGTG